MAYNPQHGRTRNAADREAVRIARRQDEQRERARVGAIFAVMSTPAGRRMLWDLLGMCGVFGSVYASGDPHKTAHNSGRQDVGHELFDELNQAHPDGFALMQHEAHERAKRDRAEIEAAHIGAVTTEEQTDDDSSNGQG